MADVSKADVISALASADSTSVETTTLFARRKAAEPTQLVVTIYDKFWNRVGECGDYIDLSASQPRNGVPVLTLNLKGTDPMVAVIRKCRYEVVGITVELGSVRWAYTVDSCSYTLDAGQRTLKVKALGLYDYLSYLQVWPNYWAPIAAQLPSRAVYLGPICSVIESIIAENAWRLQLGLWELVNNVVSLNFDWRAWFGRTLQSRGNFFDRLTTPIYVIRHNFLFDSSPFVAHTFRMESAAAAIDKVIKGYGVTVEINLWLPGDAQPDAYSNLRVPTYVVKVSDRSNVTGPTGTILDSVVKQIVNLGGSALGGVLQPFLNPQGRYAPDGVYIAPAIGVDYVQPWALLIDHPRGPMEAFEITDHHPQGWQIIVGGKSPKWINDLINATTSWILDSLMIVIGLTGVPSNLFDGIFNDVFLAFQLVENFDRRNAMGPYGRPEKFLPTGSAPYNIDALMSFIEAMWDSRGYRAGTVQFRNGYPYSIGRDIFLGSMMSIADLTDNTLYTDYVTNLIIQDNRKERTKVIAQIGDGKGQEAPIARFQRLITGVQEAINTLTITPG